MNTLTRLAVSNDRKNRARSVLIIISVLLTTMLLTMIATFGYGLIRFNHVNADKLYGSYYGSYRGITGEQLKEMKLRSEFSKIGISSLAGEVKDNKNMNLYWLDDTTRELVNLNQDLQEGRFAEKENEIAAEASFFEKLGVKDPKVGDRVTLLYRGGPDHKYEQYTFHISGILYQKKENAPKGNDTGYVSEDFYHLVTPLSERRYQAYFRLDSGVAINNETAEDVIKELAGKCKIDERRVSVNSYYLMWAMDPGTQTIIVCVVIALMIILFSVAVIYHIFQVGLVQKIQEYGKLKALGMTRGELRKVIFLEGMLLGCFGIPLGILAGYLTSRASFSWISRQSAIIREGERLEQISLLCPPLLLLVIFISFLTIWAALRKPMKIVAFVSPVEAIRFQVHDGKKKEIRKKNGAINLKGLLLANLSINRKSVISTICTMGLSCVLFVIITNFVGNIDPEFDARRTVEYGQFSLQLDYSLNDTAYPENNLDQILKENPFNSRIVNEIKAINGVTDVKLRRILAMKDISSEKQGKDEFMSVMVLDREGFTHAENRGGRLGSFDYQKAAKENAILFGWSHFISDYGYSLDQPVDMVLTDGSTQVEVTAPVIGSFGSIDTDWAITEDTYQKLGLTGDNISCVWVDCKKQDMIKVKKELEQIIADRGRITIDSYQDALEESTLSMQLMQMICYMLLMILGLIGFMNMANTIIMSIITRKQEFGILQAIGMTNKQLNRMLQLEGLIFTAGTAILALTIGSPIGYAVFRYGKKNGFIGLNVYHFPWVEMTGMILSIALLQIILSYLLSHNLKKESLVERIRYQE